MKIALVQFAPVLGNPKATCEKLVSLLDQAKEADLLVLPELANTGYNFSSREQALELAEDIKDSRYLNLLMGKCREYNYWVVTGFGERENQRLFNSALLLSPEGVEGHYRKLHLFWNEKNIFEPGDLGLPIFDSPWGKVGMLVCFDWMFPEVWRLLALEGCRLICHPSNLVLPYAQGVVPSYALTNRLFVVTTNRVGEEGSLRFTGNSVVASPKGEILVRGAEDLEEVLMVTIDPTEADNKMITPENHAFESRRTDIYSVQLRKK